MSDVFVDSNVLIYAIDRSDERRRIASNLLRQGCVVSVQCLKEFGSVAYRKLKLSWPDVQEAASNITRLCTSVIPLTLGTHVAALQLAQRYRLALWDAMIVAAALEARCDTLYSEDMHHGLVVEGRLTITNPFRG